MSAFGMSSRSSSTRLSAKVVVRKLTPVTLPPGRARLATRANLTGSSPVMNAMGIVDVAALAAIVAGAPVDAITATCRLTRSAANRGNRSSSPSAHSNSIVTFRPTSRPVSFTPSRKAAIRLAYPAGDALLRNPITGIADGCAFAPDRPRRRCAAEQRDELAPPHSMTSVASASTVGGIVRSRAFAVLRLIAKLKLVDTSTGSSAGFSPLRMRPV